MTSLIYKEEAYSLIGLAMDVHNELGNGFLEPVYQEAFEMLLKQHGIPYTREQRLPIYFRGQKLAKEYIADFICYGKIIIELKAVSSLSAIHEAQLLNYLKATNMKLGLLINFGESSLKYRRIIH